MIKKRSSNNPSRNLHLDIPAQANDDRKSRINTIPYEYSDYVKDLDEEEEKEIELTLARSKSKKSEIVIPK